MFGRLYCILSTVILYSRSLFRKISQNKRKSHENLKLKSIINFLKNKPTLNMSILLTGSASRLRLNETKLIILQNTRSCKNISKSLTGSESRSKSNETILIFCKLTCKNLYNVETFTYKLR
jgi:hypothetical protein